MFVIFFFEIASTSSTRFSHPLFMGFFILESIPLKNKNKNNVSLYMNTCTSRMIAVFKVGLLIVKSIKEYMTCPFDCLIDFVWFESLIISHQYKVWPSLKKKNRKKKPKTKQTKNKTKQNQKKNVYSFSTN